MGAKGQISTYLRSLSIEERRALSAKGGRSVKHRKNLFAVCDKRTQELAARGGRATGRRKGELS